MLYGKEVARTTRREPSILDMHKEEMERKERLKSPVNKTFPKDKIDEALSVIFRNKTCVVASRSCK